VPRKILAAILLTSLLACAASAQHEPTLAQLADALDCQPGLEAVVAQSRPNTLEGSELRSFAPPTLRSAAPVTFPEHLRTAGYEAAVAVAVMVSPEGSVQAAIVADSRLRRDGRTLNPQQPSPSTTASASTSAAEAKAQFEQAAVGWVRQAKFDPGMINGKRVRLPVCVPVVYSLDPR
jgi:outer membrane biosynthesis protein TonB